jgi:hypothetical protein
MFESFVKQNNNENKTLCSTAPDFICLSTTVHKASPTKNMNLNYKPSSTFVFLIPHKKNLIKFAYSLKINQRVQCHGRKLTGTSFTSTSEVWTSAI